MINKKYTIFIIISLSLILLIIVYVIFTNNTSLNNIANNINNNTPTNNTPTNNNLTLNTNTLTYEDITNFYNIKDKGYNIYTSLGSDSTNQKQVNIYPDGNTSLSLVNDKREKEGISRATVGYGDIRSSVGEDDNTNNNNIISNNTNNNNLNSNNLNSNNLNNKDNLDLIKGLNRDITNTQVITKDKILNSLNSELNIDNRVFSKNGREEIKSEVVNAGDNAKFYLDYTLGATVRALNPFRISYYSDRAFAEEADINLKEKEIETAHQRSAEAYGNYVNSALVGSIIRTAGETGQFFMYTTQDIYTRIKSGGKETGPYQPYKWSSENGGLIDSYYDVMNVVNGAQGKYEFQPNQSIVNKYNNEDYNKYINNGRKW